MRKKKVEIKVGTCFVGKRNGYFWRVLGDEGEITNSLFLNDETFATESEAKEKAKEWAKENGYSYDK